MSWFRHHPELPEEATVVVERGTHRPFWIGMGIVAGVAAAALITWAVLKPKDDGAGKGPTEQGLDDSGDEDEEGF